MSTEHDVKVIRITEIKKHPNADSLSITEVDGRPVIFKTGEYNSGDLSVYIPIDAILPLEDSRWDFLNGKNRIKAKRLRGIFSMGLLTKPNADWIEGQDVKELLGITDYQEEDRKLDNRKSGSYGMSDNEKDPGFIPRYTDIESLRKYKKYLDLNEEVVAIEKIHGANGRLVYSNNRLWVGSRTQIKRDPKKGLITLTSLVKPPESILLIDDRKERAEQLKNFYSGEVNDLIHAVCNELNCEIAHLPYRGQWKIRHDDLELVKEKINALNLLIEVSTESSKDINCVWWTIGNALEEKLKLIPDIIIYGEVYGQVQDLKYGVINSVKFAAFDAFDIKVGKYLDFDPFLDLMNKLGIDTCPILYRGLYQNLDWNLSNGKSILGNGSCIREGFVIRPIKERVEHCGRIIFKLVGEDYLLRK